MNLSAVTLPRNLKGSMLTRFVGVGVVLDTNAKSLANADYVDNSSHRLASRTARSATSLV